MGAAYGVIVAVFQWGWLGGLIGIGATGPIDPWIPLMMFTILFGLSMDYEVFLLSRMREEWRLTHDNSSAVADGLAKTARVITAAAAIMICVFGSFVIGDPLHVLKVFGLGLAAAILIDATLVRMVLVPSVMELHRGRQLVDAVVARPGGAQAGHRGGRGQLDATGHRRSFLRGSADLTGVVDWLTALRLAVRRRLSSGPRMTPIPPRARSR